MIVSPSTFFRTANIQLVVVLLLVLSGWSLSIQSDDSNLNRVPNPGFMGVDGLKAGNVNGTVPDFWRGFGVGNAEISLERVPLAANTLFPGSPATNAIKLTIDAFDGGGQGFDHEAVPFTFSPGHDYSVDVYMRSANAGGADQGVSVSFPVFDASGFTGRQPGGFNATVTNEWTKFTGPSFMEVAATAGDIAFRLDDDGGDNAILIAMPVVNGPASETPQPDYPSVFTSGRDFSDTDRYVSTSVFHWYNIFRGQKDGPWLPENGRVSWTGEVPFWREQIKDMMDANIDVIYVHLINGFDFQREQLFRALSQLREEGYDTPYVVPFMDPLIIWSGAPIDMSTTAGKDGYVDQYRRWFEQYFRHNTDAHAESRLLHINGKVVLNTWHSNPGFTNNMASFTRNDLETRLAALFGDDYPSFHNGVYQIGTTNGIAPVFADEIAHQFSNTAYFSSNTAKARRPATMKPGYWDQNVRDPGSFLARDGGGNYRQAWVDLNAAKNGSGGMLPIYHAYIESWNEYDEGTGIYAGDAGAPFIAPGNTSGNTDSWSDSGNPREYIDATFAGASLFNDTPMRDSLFLWNNFPDELPAGESMTVKVLVRNTGDEKWSGNAGIQLGQHDSDSDTWGAQRQAIDDDANEVDRFGGVFRGRPVLYEFMITAPAIPGDYEVNYQMLKANGVETWFGDTLTISIKVIETGGGPGLSRVRRFVSFDNDGVDDALLRHQGTGRWHINFMNFRQVRLNSGLAQIFANQDWQMMGAGDFSGNGRGDVLLRHKNLGTWSIFMMNGRNSTNGQANLSRDPNWEIAAIDDFDGDGKDDILLRHRVTGRWFINFMKFRLVRLNSGPAVIFANQDWQMMGTGDFSGNGRGDVLLRHRKLGTWSIFMMNGRNSTNGEAKLSRDPNWQIAAIDDFDGDGKDDILLRHRITGRWFINFMNFRQVRLNSGLTNIYANPVWQMMGTGDFSANGRGDVLLRNRTSGTWLIFLMNGRNANAGFTKFFKDLNWQIP